MNKEISLRDEYSQTNQKSTVISPKVTVIFPAKNEESTIEGVISVVSESTFDPDVMVVDAYSSDKTVELAVKVGTTVIQQSEQVFPGKGIAMKSWIKQSN